MPTTRCAPLCCVLSLLTLASAGCFAPEGPPLYPVAGEVTFEGAPLADGTIIFEPIESDGTRPASGRITDGKFAFEIEEGAKRVRIRAEREVGEVDPAMGARQRANYIPAKYNSDSELTAEVTTQGDQNTYRFELEAK